MAKRFYFKLTSNIATSSWIRVWLYPMAFSVTQSSAESPGKWTLRYFLPYCLDFLIHSTLNKYFCLISKRASLFQCTSIVIGLHLMKLEKSVEGQFTIFKRKIFLNNFPFFILSTNNDVFILNAKFIRVCLEFRLNKARWLFLSHFWPLLEWVVFFRGNWGIIAKIGLSLKPNQVRLVQDIWFLNLQHTHTHHTAFFHSF